jgi:hypothetical protein
MTCDADDRLRKEASKCVSKALDCMMNNRMSLDSSMTILLAHVRCGLTHLNPLVVNDVRDLFQTMISKASEKMQQQFVEVVLTRFKSKTRASDLDLAVAMDIIEKFFKCSPVVITSIPSFDWRTFSGYIPREVMYKPVISNQYNMTFPKSSTKDSKEELKQLLRDILKEKVEQLKMMIGESMWAMDFEEAKSWIVVLKLLNFLDMRLPAAGLRPRIEIRLSSNAAKSPAKQKSLPTVTQTLNRLWANA